MKNIDEINEYIKSLIDTGISVKEISDGHHTFKELYKQRIIFLSIICNCYSEIFWKSRKHFDEENDPMFNGDFIIGINTPEGVTTYHIKNEYWSLFDIPEIENAPKYDNYTVDDAMNRLLSLKSYLRK